MMNIKDLSVLVVDRGLFFGFAQRLARDFGTVYYYVSNDSPFPTPHLNVIGDGFENVQRVQSCHALEPDVYAFPDVGMADVQADLRRQGALVWGSGDASSLELKRLAFKELQAKLGMDVPPYATKRGVRELREYLNTVSEAYIKISTYRGLMETYHHHDPDKTGLFLDHLAVQLGPLQDNLLFLVEEPIQAIVETGLDTFCVGSHFPKQTVQGIEAKDKGYAGIVTPWDKLPVELTDLANRLAPELKSYANFFSMEVRITPDGKSYLTDPTMRHATPAGECLLELIENLGEIVYHGTLGQLVEPQYAAPCAMQALVDHPEDETFWRSAKIDSTVDRWFKPYSACQIDGTLYFPPLPWSCETIGSVVAIGDNFDQCLKQIKERAELLEQAGLEVHVHSLADVIQSIHQEEVAGVPFSDQSLPAPEDVLPDKTA